MISFDFIKKNKLLVIFSIGLIIILGELSYLYLIKYKNPSPNYTIKSDLKDYDFFRQKVQDIALNQKVVGDSNYGRLLKHLSRVENKSLSSAQRYDAITQAQGDIRFLYTDTHDSRFRNLNSSLEEVAKLNFPNLYKKNAFVLYCQDISCQDTPQPKEILKIVNEIKATSVADYSKKSSIDNLINVGYISKKDVNAKVWSYIVASRIIRNDGEFVKMGINKQISNEINDYLLSNFPNNVNQVLGLKTIQESRQKLESY